MFQGGFVGNEGFIEIGTNSTQDMSKLCNLQNIDDKNDIQNLYTSSDDISCRYLKITFTSSTDFYGRITVYKLDILKRK